MHIFAPPPFFWFIFFSQMKFNIMTGCAPQAKKFQPFFVQFCKVLVNWGKNMHFFFQLGKKYAFSPRFFFIPFQSVIWPYFCPPPGGEGVKQKNIHPCLYVLFVFSVLVTETSHDGNYYVGHNEFYEQGHNILTQARCPGMHWDWLIDSSLILLN